MIFGHIRVLDDILPLAPPALRLALTYLATTDFDAVTPGTHDLAGQGVRAEIKELTSGTVDENAPERHRDHADVHFLWRGAETIGFAPDRGGNPVAADLLGKSDILFYERVDGEIFLPMSPGHFVLFMPSDIHRPGCCRDGDPGPIRKVVVKIRMDLLRRPDTPLPQC